MLKPLHDPKAGVLRVAGLMSGSGTNMRRILETEKRLEAERGTSPFKVVAIFSDNTKSQAVTIGTEYDVPVIVRDIRAFYAARNTPRSDLSLRTPFDTETVRALSAFDISVMVYAGYMSIASDTLVSSFFGINVHPSDLTIMEDGKRKYTGDHAVRDAIVAGEQTISSTTHVVELEVDGGRLLMISPPLPVELPENADFSDKELVRQIEDSNQDRLKEAGDWVIFPQTLIDIADGRYAEDESGCLHYDGKPIPNGYRLG